MQARHVVLERDLNGDGSVDRVWVDDDTCGSAGCAYTVELAGRGQPYVLRVIAKDFWPAGTSTDGVTDLEFAEVDFDATPKRYVVRYRWSDGRYIGPLDHLPRNGRLGPPASHCQRAVVRTAAPVLVLPARHIEMSSWDDTGWHRGPPATTTAGALEPGREVIVYNEVVDREGVRWVSLEFPPDTAHLRWVDAAALRCVEYRH